MGSDNLDTIISLVQISGKISNITPAEDFYEAGFSSINALQLLLDLESAFDITIPDDDFIAARTCISLDTLVARLQQGSR